MKHAGRLNAGDRFKLSCRHSACQTLEDDSGSSKFSGCDIAHPLNIAKYWRPISLSSPLATAWCQGTRMPRQLAKREWPRPGPAGKGGEGIARIIPHTRPCAKALPRLSPAGWRSAARSPERGRSLVPSIVGWSCPYCPCSHPRSSSMSQYNPAKF